MWNMRKINLGTILGSVIAGSVALSLTAIILISSWLEQGEVKQRLQAKVTSTAAIAAPYAAYIIVKGDDLALVELMKNMALQPGITHAIVTNSNGVIVAHSQPSEIGNTIKPKPGIGEFSYSLNNLGAPGHVLNIGAQPFSETVHKKHLLVNLIIFAIVITIMFGGLWFFLAQKQNKKINQWLVLLKQLLPAGMAAARPKVPEQGNWEQLTQLFNEISSLAASGELGSSAEQKRTHDINAVLSGIGKSLEQPVIMLDAANRIVFANAGGKELMLNDQHDHDPAGAYFSEICRNAELVEGVRLTSPESATPVALNLKSSGKTVKINFLAGETNQRLGVIILGA